METTNIPSADAQPSDEAARIDTAPGVETLAPVIEPPARPTAREVIETKHARRRRRNAMIPAIFVGVLMFVLGGLGGFVARPYIMPPSPSPTQTQPAAQQQQAKMQAILDMLVSKTRHFKGNPNAPVTLLEFGDFQ
jgi:hypothetical protein